MSVNRELPHVYILPEDEANAQIATGFRLELNWQAQSRIRILDEAGGWLRVLEAFEKEQLAELDRRPHRSLILLIDFDGFPERIDTVRERIPARLSDRVFVLGSLREPEDLKRAGLGSLEDMGTRIAIDCREGSDTIWCHELLSHNQVELTRLRQFVF